MHVTATFGELERMDPIVFSEKTDYGWRGLTAHGEVLEVKVSRDSKVVIPSDVLVSYNGRPIGERSVTNEWNVDIDNYLLHFNRGIELYKSNRTSEALDECDKTLAVAPTLRAKFNRSMILLAMGKWNEGLQEYWDCEQSKPFMRPPVKQALEAGLIPWRGEKLSGKRLLLLHAHGFGDTIQTLRYLPELYGMGAKIAIDVPQPLRRLARWPHGEDGDFFCPMLHLMYMLAVTPQNIDPRPYLNADDHLIEKWRDSLGPKCCRRIGLAWSVGKPSDGDYPREIELSELAAAFPDSELHSVQVQDKEKAAQLGVHVHEFEDFADCAALMLNMDQIVSVDTAALHLAGAIGHPLVYGLLSNWASWRWIASWYKNVKLCRQVESNDWRSALAQVVAH
jgi:hypothetical protein